MNMKNKNLAMLDVAEAIPLNPNKAAIIATTKNTIDQYNMILDF
ncbi:hypothetical protein EV198_1592 [Roseivirga ehrenbergii]|nr:hypothetical protein EV198_1592 [Roseivirga ehrenbergii]